MSASVKLAPGSLLKVNVMIATWPTFSGDLSVLKASVRLMVSKDRLGVVPASPLLSAQSV
jgi:hypothetical protein